MGGELGFPLLRPRADLCGVAGRLRTCGSGRGGGGRLGKDAETLYIFRTNTPAVEIDMHLFKYNEHRVRS